MHYGYVGSAAETYAKNDGVTFKTVSHDASINNFIKRYAYISGQFTDVDKSSWYGLAQPGAVASACGLGIMNGMSSCVFSPNGMMTLAEKDGR